ncbi:MAG: radical SAM family heme chaperone HemW [Treponema sp.]
MKPSGLYIHIPFCTQKCRYCDFYSCTDASDFQAYGNNRAFISTILNDIAFFKERYAVEYWKTVYIGGGTPSLLSPADICFLGTRIRQSQPDHQIEEFTIEANPEDIHPEWLSACREGGINRLSIGIQSFDDTVLAVNGRRGSGKKTLKALDTIKTHWHGLLSCDLIAGLKEQTERSLTDDLRRLIDYRIEHLSLYGLCSEEPLADTQEDFISDLLTGCSSILSSHDYIQYEVSNFSYQNLYKSIHNQIYWQMEPYIGVGPAACGTLIHEDAALAFTGAERLEGVRDISQWHSTRNRDLVYAKEVISKTVFLEEVLMMGFRLTEGIDRKRFRQRFGTDIGEYIGRTLRRWESTGLCRVLPDRAFLTAEGLFFLNRFLVEALSELDMQIPGH